MEDVEAEPVYKGVPDHVQGIRQERSGPRQKPGSKLEPKDSKHVQLAIIYPSPQGPEEFTTITRLVDILHEVPVLFLLDDPVPPMQALALSKGIRALLPSGKLKVDQLPAKLVKALNAKT